MVKNIDIFEKLPVPKAVLKLALPTVLSMIVAVFYNMVDAYFVGKIDKTGELQFAAVNVATPIFLYIMAIGNIFGMGGSSFISRALGEKNIFKVKNISSFCLYTGIFVGIISGTIILFLITGDNLSQTKFLSLIGIKDDTFNYAVRYLKIIACGAPLIVISNGFTNIIRGEGAAKNATIGMMAGTFANIILDPIFILDGTFLGIPCLGWEVDGAAYATLIGNAVTFLVYFIHAQSSSSTLSLNPKYFKLRGGILKGVFAIGLPAALTNILMSTSSIITNSLLSKYEGGTLPQAAMGVALKANMFVIFIMLGIAMGISPLIGYNYGAKNFKRMKATMKFGILLNIITGLTITTLYFIFTEEIINIFAENFENHETIMNLAIMMIYSLMIPSPIIGVLFVLNFSFQAMGKGLQSMILAISRQGIIFMPLVFILDYYFGLKGVVFTQPIADFASVILAILMFLQINKKSLKIQQVV